MRYNDLMSSMTAPIIDKEFKPKTGRNLLQHANRKMTMDAERLILETDQSGNLINPPKLPANKQIEASFLVLEEVPKRVKRTPHPDIAGKIQVIGNIFDSAPSSDWDSSV